MSCSNHTRKNPAVSVSRAVLLFHKAPRLTIFAAIIGFEMRQLNNVSINISPI
jgi:hypothetical protein